MFANLKPMEIIIIVVVIVLVFGAAKLPNIASNIGKSLKVFKKEVKELRSDDDVAPAPTPAATSGVQVDPVSYQPPQQPAPVVQPVAQPAPVRPEGNPNLPTN